jgi:HK97 family phage prohead protease
VDERGAVRVAGQVTDPRATERLHEYWVHGEGAAKVAWGTPGDFDRCVAELGKYIKDPQGYCNLAHHAALGIWPAQHAAMEKKATGRSAVTVTQRAEMTASSINDLPDSDFAYIAPGGTKDGSGRTVPRSNRYLPVHDKTHVQNALARLPQTDIPAAAKAQALTKIKAAARRFGVDASDDGGGGSSASRADPVYFRTYELEDIHIVRAAQGDSTGRLVEAYATAFNSPAEIQDFEGHYIEEIDPAAFNKVLADIGRSRAGFGKVKVMYNHGMTIHGTPSERGSMPIATPVEIRPEARGLLTLARYSDTPFADEVLENIRNGSITAQSFTGRIVRSTPQLRPGDRYRPRGGQLPRVRRTELGLKEFGPTPFEAYSGAEILGVRMSTPGTFGDPEPDEHDEHEEHEEFDTGTSPDGEAAAGEPPQPDGEEHSARYHQHALYAMRSKELREQAGLVW